MTKDQFKEQIDNILVKTFESMATAKFYILISSSLFFWFGKLDQGNWVSTVLVVAGLREAVNIATIAKGQASGKAGADNGTAKS